MCLFDIVSVNDNATVCTGQYGIGLLVALFAAGERMSSGPVMSRSLGKQTQAPVVILMVRSGLDATYSSTGGRKCLDSKSAMGMPIIIGEVGVIERGTQSK